MEKIFIMLLVLGWEPNKTSQNKVTRPGLYFRKSSIPFSIEKFMLQNLDALSRLFEHETEIFLQYDNPKMRGGGSFGTFPKSNLFW